MPKYTLGVWIRNGESMVEKLCNELGFFIDKAELEPAKCPFLKKKNILCSLDVYP